MWNPTENWQAQSSYAEHVTPPSSEPDATPLVCVQFNQNWLPYILGSLLQLTQPAAWAASSPAALQTVLDQATRLVEVFGEAALCTMLTFRFTSGCVLQFSLDGGTTWTDVSGWPTFAPGCYTGATGPPGPTGPPGAWDPGNPGNPFGVSVAQQACNIAGYLATQIIQQSISQAVTSISATQTYLNFQAALTPFLTGFDPVLEFVAIAAAALYAAIQAGTLAHFSFAATDAALWSAVTCAIYGATKTDGYVTSANFAAVHSAIAALSYTYPDVITVIAAYVNNLTAVGLRQLQLAGAVAIIDCSGCGTPPLNALQFVASATGNGGTLASGIDFGTGNFTVGYWWQSTDTTHYQGHFQAGSTGGNPATFLYQQPPQYAETDVRDSTPTDRNIGGGNLTDGARHLVVWTVAASSAQQLYVDGASVASAGLPAMGSVHSAGALSYWGKAPNSGLPSATGLMWGMAVYVGTALSSSDVATWHTSGPGARPPGSPSHWWPCNEGAGTTAADNIGGNTLTGGFGWATHA